jgi:porphobilinogen synthase
MTFPIHRLRRLRKNDAVRRLVRETTLTTDDLIYPLFVVGEDNIRSEIREISGSYYLSGKYLVEEAKGIRGLGIPAVLLFGIPLENQRDESASLSYSPLGPVQKAVKILKSAVPVGGARKEPNMAAVARCRHRSGREKPSINPAGDELIHKSKQICKFILI